jgi:hypothetical protein
VPTSVTDTACVDALLVGDALVNASISLMSYVSAINNVPRFQPTVTATFADVDPLLYIAVFDITTVSLCHPVFDVPVLPTRDWADDLTAFHDEPSNVTSVEPVTAAFVGVVIIGIPELYESMFVALATDDAAADIDNETQLAMPAGPLQRTLLDEIHIADSIPVEC